MMKSKKYCLLLLLLLVAVLAGCGKSPLEETSLFKDKGEVVLDMDQADPVGAVYQIFEDTVTNIQNHINEGWTEQSAAMYGIPQQAEGAGIQLGYAVSDLDGDGIKELIIGGQTYDEIAIRIYDLFTVGEDGKLQRPFISDGTSFLKALEDQTFLEQRFTDEGQIEDIAFYRMEAGALKRDRRPDQLQAAVLDFALFQ